MEEAYQEAAEADKKLQEKILTECEGLVVRKDLAFQVKNNLAVPTFVLEFLLAQYCASADEKVVGGEMTKLVYEAWGGEKALVWLENGRYPSVYATALDSGEYDAAVSAMLDKLE